MSLRKVNARTLGSFHAHLTKRITEGDISQAYAAGILTSVKSFLPWLWKSEAIDNLPRNLDDLHIKVELDEINPFTKKEMVNLLSAAPGRNRLYLLLMLNCGFTESLSDDQKEWFRATSEAQIAQWARRLGLVEPVTADELMEMLDDAIQRQESLPAKREPQKEVGCDSALPDDANGNGTQPATKRVYVDLWAHETIVETCRLVVEVLVDCPDSELRQLSASWLDCQCIDQGGSPCWEETGNTYGQEIHDDIEIQSGVPDDEEPDIVLARNDAGELEGAESCWS